MSNLSAFIVMSALEAARFRDYTKDDENRLDPVLIRGGPFQGKYALQAEIKTDPLFEDHWDAFAMCDEVALDLEVAFPPDPNARGI